MSIDQVNTEQRFNIDDDNNNNQPQDTKPRNIFAASRGKSKSFLSKRFNNTKTRQERIEPLPSPDSNVENIVQRLQYRNDRQVPVPIEVKTRFLKLCKEACVKRMDEYFLNMGMENPANDTTSRRQCTCILRKDVIQIRKQIRLEVENRTRFKGLVDRIKTYTGFRCHDIVLLNVLNRAVDSIDESSNHANPQRCSTSSFCGISNLDENIVFNSEEYTEWFYYKDFAFYNLKVESNYPWMRSTIVFSLLITCAFYLFTPILWCVLLKDENICPTSDKYDRTYPILHSLYFASKTASTVGYGDVTIFVGEDERTNPQEWRIFIATLYMVVSIVVSILGLNAGLESHFHPFERRLDSLAKRVFEILIDAHIIKGANDKYDELISRMRWAKFVQLADVALTFFVLNLVGVFALQLSLLGEKEDEFGYKLSISWMKSMYWAVQTTTTIGYGDVTIPGSLHWFMLIYLAFSTYYVGSALGKLGELSKNLESMKKMYLWQQQEATYTMLADFSGRPERWEKGCGDEGDEETANTDPEIDQFEFTIASLVLMGKITSEDVRPILEKFNKLAGDKNKITAADVSGPMKKKQESEKDEGKNDEQIESIEAENASSPPLSSITVNEEQKIDIRKEDFGSILTSPSARSSVMKVGKKIAVAFRDEVLIGKKDNIADEMDSAPDYSKFQIPKKTYAIAIDDSKIQRKLVGKFFDFLGIPSHNTTIVGDGHDEIMGFEDFVVNFMENRMENYDFVFLLVDENLDVVDEDSKRQTISGSFCMENIRKRTPRNLEKRMFALIRSANDSSSDIAVYSTRAHGFLPKAPMKRDKIIETLAPLWLKRFPPSEFGGAFEQNSRGPLRSTLPTYDNACECNPYEIDQKIHEIESLFENNFHVSDLFRIKEKMHELKGDLLTLNTSFSVTSIIGDINLILVAQTPETVKDRWHSVRDHVNEITRSIEEHFRIPKNTFAIAIDDSSIQRKLLAKLFTFLGIPSHQCIVMGDGNADIEGFEDFVVSFMENHKNDYVFIIVDENLDVANESLGSNTISGSACVENIRKRLPFELEKRTLVLIRSADDSTSDIEIYNSRAHGFLPKAPIKRDKIKKTIAPLWVKRFPPSEFGDSLGFDDDDDAASQGTLSDYAECTPGDISQKLLHIDVLFKENIHIANWHMVHDQLHMLKGDLLTMNSSASIISILGMINLMLLGQSQDPNLTVEKWNSVQERICRVFNLP